MRKKFAMMSHFVPLHRRNKPQEYVMGSIILDLTGLTLSQEEREILQHPQLAGIIFFSRNYESPQQLTELISQIRECSTQRLLLTVDQEGGRVQRFLSGFTALPPLGKLGALYTHNPDRAVQLAQLHGWLMASELLTLGLDLSFTPVLDLDTRSNRVIGNRAFHGDPIAVTNLARATIQGIHDAGMCALGKHFPGHGSVAGDTHIQATVDPRDYETIAALDLLPFSKLSVDLDAVMTSHVIYKEVDPYPCSLSSFWLQTILRKKLNFSGAIFTDDLSMRGIENMGSITERTQIALQAGCNGLLICNHRKAAVAALEYLERTLTPNSSEHLQKLFSRRTLGPSELRQTAAWRSAVRLLAELNDH